MRYELRLHRVTFGILAVVLMAFVAFLFYIRPSESNISEKYLPICCLDCCLFSLVCISQFLTQLRFRLSRLWQRLMLCCSVWQNCASLSTWRVTPLTERRYSSVDSLRSLSALYSSAGQSFRQKEARPCWAMSPSFPSCNYFHFSSTLAPALPRQTSMDQFQR